MPSLPQVFYADVVSFDMVCSSNNPVWLVHLQDGTLTDSTSAVEAAWSKFAQDIGEDPEYVVAATHGKRAVDNLSHFKPHIKEHEMEDEVTEFEESILFFANAHKSFMVLVLSSGISLKPASSRLLSKYRLTMARVSRLRPSLARLLHRCQ